MCSSPIAYHRLLPDLLGACHAFLCTATIASPTPTPRNLQKPVITNDRPANLRCLKSNFDELTARLAGRAARKNTWQSWAHDTSRICYAIVANIYWLGLVTVAVVAKGTPRLQGPDTGKRASVLILRNLQVWPGVLRDLSTRAAGPLTHMTRSARNLANLQPKSASNNQHAFSSETGVPLGSKYPSS